jgi:hypothetical protein
MEWLLLVVKVAEHEEEVPATIADMVPSSDLLCDLW